MEQGHSKEYRIDLNDGILEQMTALREIIVPQIAAEFEVKQKEFSYFMLQSLHTRQRTQALTENTFYKYKGDRKPNFKNKQ